MPVIMFHSVGLHRHAWPAAHIAEPPELFSAKIDCLNKYRYTSCFFFQYDQPASTTGCMPSQYSNTRQ